MLTGTHAGLFLTGIWGAALAGASLILFGPRAAEMGLVVLYLAMGWAAALFGGPLFAALSPVGFALILAGGVLYTLGVVFFLWERLPFHNTIWHVFVLTATSCSTPRSWSSSGAAPAPGLIRRRRRRPAKFLLRAPAPPLDPLETGA